MMMQTCNGNCGREELSLYREQRWQESAADNGNFFFGPGSLLLYGAATFLYELFPAEGGRPDEATMMSFFSISKDSSGNYVQNDGERAPPGWRPRIEPYGGGDVVREILAMYLANVSTFNSALVAEVTDNRTACSIRWQYRQRQFQWPQLRLCDRRWLPRRNCTLRRYLSPLPSHRFRVPCDVRTGDQPTHQRPEPDH